MTTMILSALLALAAAPALAAIPVDACDKPIIVATLPNQSGNSIMFLTTFENCPEGTPGYDVISSIADGSTIKGCWVAEQDVIMVEWNDKTSYVYPVEKITFTKKWTSFSECQAGLKEKNL